jgi:hypothetical protein
MAPDASPPTLLTPDLVGQQDLGRLDQRAGDGDSLLLAAGQLGGQVPGPVAEADVGQRALGTLAALGRWDPGGTRAVVSYIGRGSGSGGSGSGSGDGSGWSGGRGGWPG